MHLGLTFTFLDRESALNFMEAMQPVAKRILSCFATALGYPANFFDEVRLGLGLRFWVRVRAIVGV